MAKGDACEICGTTEGRIYNSKKFGMKLCDKHWAQIERLGYIPDRTNADDNEIITYDTYAEVVLFDRDNIEKARVLIDIDDVDKIIEHKWCLNNCSYAVTNPFGKLLLMHRLIMDCPDGMFVDHINHDTLDNRKNNLRICTFQQNKMNLTAPKSNKSGHIGVSYSTERNKWVAQITVNGHHLSLGRFSDIEDAVAARKKAEDKYFGEYAYRGEVS